MTSCAPAFLPSPAAMKTLTTSIICVATRLQADLQPPAGQRRRSVLAADGVVLGERAELARGGAYDRRDDRPLLCQLRPAAWRRHPRHRRHARYRARASAAFPVQQPLRRALLSADPCL